MTTKKILTTAIVSVSIIPILLLNVIRLKIDYTPADADPFSSVCEIGRYTQLSGNSTMF
ncbi:hypothetical protein SDC9_140972 [bioreactor metagenome]|uniref:Uncharacterized protein n=1 Tax=bioreactor metagenome TaxID=1076179 RepID=A0A645DWE3_9ZZZZ